MRILTVPAQYAPELERAMLAAVREILADAKLRDDEAPFAGGFIPDAYLDRSLTGTLLVTVALLPDEASVAVFPVEVAA